ncbi:MAG: VanZ family protein [Deltaproteobacteria bacterium]|nr:VanZ family protein [Deltaproteobacteria bacterium]
MRSLGKRAYAGLLLLAVLVALQAFVFNRGIPRVDIVEKVHFIQYGLLALLLYRAVRVSGDLSMVAIPLLGALATGSLEEWVQWLVPLRVGEVMDVALNLYAGACGLVLGWTVYPPAEFRFRLPAPSLRLVSGFAASAILLFGLFYHCAHLGYLLRDPEIGEFRSWHSLRSLEEKTALYAALWQRQPPQLDRVLDVENRFATEAGWHVSARNGAYSRGDYCTALKENQILEKYFQPFLDIPNKNAAGTRRLSSDQDRELETKTAGKCPDFRSEALENRIDTRIHKKTWWLFVTSLLGIVGAIGIFQKQRKASGKGKSGSSGGT